MNQSAMAEVYHNTDGHGQILYDENDTSDSSLNFAEGNTANDISESADAAVGVSLTDPTVTATENGYIYENPVESFPAKDMVNAENFVSLLFYYGMLTIGDVEGADVKLTIPNNNVRKQYYDYLFRQYQEIAYVDTRSLSRSYTEAALRGNWQPMIKEITDAYEKTTSIRQLIEGERNLQGFMNAYLALNPYYLTAPEMELSHGYCDFFLMPDLNRYPMIGHSYILELKYLKQSDDDSIALDQWKKAVEQIRLYSQAPMVRTLIKSTVLHLLVVQIKGYNMVRAEEIEL
jgi:hypothetical protein